MMDKLDGSCEICVILAKRNAAEIPILTVTPYENAYVAEVAFETSFPNKL